MWSSITKRFSSKTTNNITRQVLIRIPLAVIKEGIEDQFVARLSFLEAKEKKAAEDKKALAAKSLSTYSKPYNGTAWNPDKKADYSKQYPPRELFDQDEKEEKDLEKQHQKLMSKLLAHNSREENSFTAVLDAMSKKISPLGEVSEINLNFHVGLILEKAPAIVSEFEGGWASDKYVNSCLNDLVLEMMEYVNPLLDTDEDPIQQLIAAIEVEVDTLENEPQTQTGYEGIE